MPPDFLEENSAAEGLLGSRLQTGQLSRFSVCLFGVQSLAFNLWLAAECFSRGAASCKIGDLILIVRLKVLTVCRVCHVGEVLDPLSVPHGLENGYCLKRLPETTEPQQGGE